MTNFSLGFDTPVLYFRDLFVVVTGLIAFQIQ